MIKSNRIGRDGVGRDALYRMQSVMRELMTYTYITLEIKRGKTLNMWAEHV